MQFFRCQTCLPAMTCGVMASACVNSPNRRWLSIVSPVKIAAKTLVPTTKKSRVCRLVIQTSNRKAQDPVGTIRELNASRTGTPTFAVSDADPRKVENGDPGDVDHGGGHGEEYHDAERVC